MLTVVRGLIIVLLIFLHVGAQCITLTSEPDTNGSYCPGQVTFTCIGTNVANGWDWVLNGTLIPLNAFLKKEEGTVVTCLLLILLGTLS